MALNPGWYLKTLAKSRPINYSSTTMSHQPKNGNPENCQICIKIYSSQATKWSKNRRNALNASIFCQNWSIGILSTLLIYLGDLVNFTGDREIWSVSERLPDGGEWQKCSIFTWHTCHIILFGVYDPKCNIELSGRNYLQAIKQTANAGCKSVT